MSVNAPAAAGRAGSREWLGLAVLCLPTLVLSVDATVLYLALPHLAEDLKPTGNQTLWIIDIFGFLLAGLLIAMGTIGDRIGRRRLLMIGAIGFGAASLIAALPAEVKPRVGPLTTNLSKLDRKPWFPPAATAAGPGGVFIGWFARSVFALIVAASMAQIASAYPTAGALYHWSSLLGGRGRGHSGGGVGGGLVAAD